MRKRLMILALVLIAVLMTCTLVACSGGGGRCSGGHTWDEGTVKEAATCTESGTLINKCTVCGIKREVAIEALGHDLQTIPGTVVEPTCEEDGYAGKKACVREGCEYVLDTGTIIPAIGHAYGDWTSNGDGTHKRVCSNDSNHVESGNCSGGTADCGHKAVCDVCGGEYGDFASSHVFDKQVTTDAYKATDATCEAKATYYYSCQCGEKGTETFEYGDYADHVFDREVADAEYLVSVATCTSPAIYNKSCACGLEGTETFEYGNALPHTFDNEVATDAYKATDATCTAKATYYYSCDCGAHGTATFAYGDMLAHVYDREVAEDKYLASAATCEKKATYYKSCYCGHFDADVSATFESGELGDHVYDNKVVNETYKATDATCTEKATYYFSCDCGKAGTETFENGETLPHTYDKEVAEDKYLKFEANCASAAVYYKSCACGHFDTETSPTFYFGAPSGNHVFDREVATDDYKATDATCTAKATYYYSCECGEKGTTTFESGATLDHTMTHTPAKAATCVATGNVEYWTCSTCSLNYDSATGGNVIEDVTTAIDSTNHVHTEITAPAVAPDCENTGLTAEVSCADCDKVLEEREEIPALGHKGGTATCKDKAVCEVCGEAYGELANHTPGEVKVENNVAPSCTAEGSYDNVIYCSVCDHELSRETITVDKVAHTGGTATCVEQATCSVCGEKYGDLADHSWNEGVVTTPATCTSEGVKTFTCTVDGCGETRTETIEKSAHNFVDNVCEDCQAKVSYVDSTIVFTFGANGKAEHKDGSPDKATYTETKDGYTLSISGGSKMYPGSFDAKGNSTLKLGTSSVVGKFEFTVPADVTEVVIYVAQYKAFTTKISVNGVAYTITTTSNDGAYTEIKVDTTVNKKVSFTTVSGGVRCMINTIEFKVSAESICNHENRKVDKVVAPTCTDAGYTSYVCSDCGHTFDADFVDAKGHTLVSIPAVAPTCENTGLTEGEMCSVCDHVTIKQTIVDMLPCVDADNDENCDNCHKPMCEHIYGDWTYASADTHKHICTLCGKEEVAGHDYKVTSHVDATCEEAGSTKYTCADCGHEYTETHVALGHDESTHDAKAPTCSAVGWEAYVTCSRCDYTTYVELPIDAEAHKWDDGEVKTPATCTEAGERLHTCEHNAEHTKVEAIPATGHAYVKNVCSVEGCGHEIPASEIVTLASALANDQTLAGGTYMLTGVVSSDVSYNSTYKNYTFNFIISGTEVEIQAYATTGNDVDKIGLGDTVTVSGTIKKFGSTLEFDKGYLESYVPGKFEVYLEVFGKGTVSGIPAGVLARGDEVTFTVNANDGYKVSKVLVNGQSITSETNEYTFVVKENTTLEVRFDKEGNNTVVEDVTGTITFAADKAQRVSYSTTQQVWKNEGVTFTNNKGSSSSNVGDYTNPVRLYKSSTVIISATGITQIVLYGSGESKYWTPFETDLKTVENATVSIDSSNKILTIKFNTPVNSFEFVCKTGQSRLGKIVVSYQVESTSGSACAHENWSDYVVTTPATCSERGVETATCLNAECGETKTRQIPVDPTLHAYNEEIKTPATCTQPGSKTLTCECGDTKTEEIAATGHKEEIIPAVAPGCESEGLTEGKKCSVCGEVLVAQTVVNALGHTEVVDAAVAATCTATGLTEGKHCSVCNKVLVAQEVVKALDHTYDQNNADAKYLATSATCEEKATYYKSCTCGHFDAEKSETFESGEVNASAHDWDEGIYTEPTCTADGYTTYTCKNNAEHKKVVTEENSKLDHTYDQNNADAEYLATPATCTAKATYYKSCSCGHFDAEKSEKFEYGEIVEDAHNWDEGAYTEPTCTADGYTTYTCKNNVEHKNVVTEENSKLDHTYDQNNTDAKYLATAATCIAKATYYKSCSCGHFDAEKSETFESGEVNASAHDLKDVAAQAHTCTEDGWNAHKACTRCDYTEDKEIDKAAHTEVVDKAVAPTCTETGLTEGKHCSVCNEVLVAQTVVNALGHTEVVDKAVAPTCTETGLTEGKHCSVCNEVLVAQTVVNALGHTEVVDKAVAPTCTETGLTEGKHCSVCNKVLVAQEVVDALDHDYKSTVTEPTCTEKGYTTHDCSRCDSSYVDTYVDATDHAYVGEVTTPATCEGKGLMTYTCKNDNSHTYTEEIKATGHAWDAGTETTPATCEADGVMTYTCTVENCGKTRKETIGKLGHEDKDDNKICDRCFKSLCEEHTSNKWESNETHHWHICTACGFKFGEVAHTAGEVVVENEIDATCTEAGSYENVVYCSVCEVELSRNKVTVDALGHTEAIDNAVAPTCTETGLTEGKHCSVCDEVLVAQTVVEAKGHRISDVNVISATCTEAGHLEIGCGDCEGQWDSRYDQVAKDYLANSPWYKLDPKGHDLVTAYEVVVDEGVKTLHKVTKCVREGCEHIAEDVTVDTTKSVAVANEKDLCTVLQNGFNAQLTEDVDLVNGSIDLVGVSATLDLNEHNISVVGTKYAETTGKYVCGVFYLDGATLTIDGEGELFASVDNADSIYVISAINESNVTLNGGTYRSSGCTTIYGRTNTTITINGGTYIAEVDWEGMYFTLDILESELKDGTNATINVYGGTFHNFDPANHTNDGTYTNKVMDGYHSIKDVDNYVVSAHTEVVDPAVAPTCTATGLTEGKHCSVCNKVLVAQEVVKALDHSWVETSRTEATCVATGAINFVCERDNSHTKTETIGINANAHNIVEHDAKAPTCTEIGWDAYVTCSRCDYTTYAEKAKLGHNFVAGNVVAPTCTADGYTIYNCSRCEATENRDYVDATGHKFDKEVAEAKYLATSATCTEKATYYKSCSCGHFDTEKSETFESGEVDASVHDLKDVAAQAHTCTEDGWNAHKACTRCDYTEGKEIDKAAHTEVVDAAVAPKCEETGLTEGKHCSVCNEVLVAQQEVAKTAHNYIDGVGICSVCGANESTISCTFAENGYANAEQVSKVSLSDVFVVTFVKGTTATAYYSDGTSIRLYAKGTLTVTGDKTIVKIIFEYGTGDKSNEFTADCGEFDGITWTGNSNQVKFTVGGTSGHRRIKTITVFYTMEKADCVSCSSTVYGTNDTHHWSICDACAFKYGYEQHSFTVENTDANYLANVATCTSAAKYYYSCECGLKGDDTFTYGDPIAHDFAAKIENENTIKSNATCQHADIYWYSCVDCGAISNEKTFESGSLAEHNDTNADGSCDDCGAALHEHSYGSWYKVDETSHRHDCNVEGCTNYEIAEHSCNEVVTPPTCTEDGYTTYTCKEGCGYSSVVTDEGSAAGHTIVNNNCSGGCGLTYTADQACLAVLENDATVLAGTFVYTGVVRSVDTAYSSEYGNITVTIDIDGTLIKCYRLGGADVDKIGVGDTITVSGKLSNYNGTVQFSAGSQMTAYSVAQFAVTFDNVENGAISELASGATFKRGSTVTFKLTADEGYVVQSVLANSTACTAGEDGFYSFVITADTIITVVIAEEGSMPEPPAVQNTTASVTIADYATANGWTNSTQYSEISVDSNITVTATGGGNTGKYYTSGTNWRIYENEDPSVTISAKEGITIVSVKVNYSVGNTGVLTLSGENIDSGSVVPVNASSITFSVGNTGTATNGQVRITGIEVVYTAGSVASCEHANKETITGTAATCTDSGLTDGTKCKDCGMVVVKQDEIPALGHNFVDGVCTRCDAVASEFVSSIDFNTVYSSTSTVNGVKHNVDQNITVIFAKNDGSTNPTYYTASPTGAVRLYAKGTLTISAPEGAKITKIVLTFGSSDNSNAITVNTGTLSGGTWSGSSNNVVFTIGGTSGHRRIATITVTYTM